MKNKIVLVLCSLNSSLSFAAIGCIDRTYHGSKDVFYHQIDPSLRDTMNLYRDELDYPNDPKVWHSVSCTCHCNKYLASYHSNKIDAGGLCPQCGHRGNVGRSNQEKNQFPLQQISTVQAG